MTSLDQQLRRLAVPQTVALLGDQKQRASLLFNKSEAATISKEALYSIGINGLQELENIDPEFQIYESSLFGEASQTFERAQRTKEENDNLDRTIEELLIKLSPYFMLRASTKVLEWLIYRYRIHLNNVDGLLTAFFPYYSTAGFVKVIQTLRLGKKTDRWHWLKPSKDHGAALSRSTLINQVLKDPNFLAFMCDIVPKHIKVLGAGAGTQLKNVVTFFSSTLVGALSLGTVKETTVSTLLPCILGGFKSKCDDFRSSSYVLTAQIASVVKLEQKFVEKLINAMTKSPGSSVKDMLLCLLVLFQTQHIDRFLKRAFKHLCRIGGLTQSIEVMAEKYEMENFLKIFYAKLIPCAIQESFAIASSSEGDDSDAGGSRPQYCSLLDSMLLSGRLQHTVAVHIVKLIVEQFEIHCESPDIVKEKICDIFSKMEKKYPEAVDELAKKLGENQSLKELLSTTSSSVLLELNHANAEVRRLAVQKLVQSREAEEMESVQELLLSRLKDDNSHVVEAVFNVDNLGDLIENRALAVAIIDVLDQKLNCKGWNNVLILCVKRLVTLWPSFDREDEVYWQIYVRLTPYFLGGPSNRNKEIVDRVLKSKVAANDPVLKRLPKLPKSSNVSHGSTFCDTYSQQPASYQEKFLKNVKLLAETVTSKGIYVHILIRFLVRMIDTAKDGSVDCLQYCQILLNIVKEKLPSLSNADRLDDAAEDVFDVESTCQLISRALDIIIRRVNLPESMLEQKWWRLDEAREMKFLSIVLDVMEIMTAHMNTDTVAGQMCNLSLKTMKDSCFTAPNTFFSLLGAVFSGHETVTPVQQLRTLYYAKISLSKLTPAQIEHLLSSESVTVPCLLLGLSSEYEPVREAACSLMTDFVVNSQSSSFRILCKRLLKVSDELKTSGEYLPQAFSTLYNDLSEKKKMKRKSGVSDNLLLMEALDQLIHTICVDDCPLQIKEGLLTCLSLVSQSSVLVKLTPLLNSLIQSTKSEVLSEAATRCCHLILHRFTPEVLHLFENDKDVLESFLSCLRSSDGHHEEYLSIQRMAVKQITKEFYASLPNDDLRRLLLANLLDIWAENENAELNKMFHKKLKSLVLHVEHVSVELRKLLPESFGTLKETKRGRRRTMEHKADDRAENVFETTPWKRTILLLEVIQNKKKMMDVEKLTSDLFSILKFTIQQENQASADYLKQLVLSCLLMIYQKLANDNLTQEELKTKGMELNVELVIQCIRTSENPQTYHHALMLLSAAVQLDPDAVLQNVMSIFTFMGANIMRQDDGYSFKVLTDTIDSIIPALLKAIPNVDGEESSGGDLLERLKINPQLAQSVKHILQVFVDTYTHIPLHRRQPLFEQLMMNLNPSRFLWLLMVLMIDSHSVKHREKSDGEGDNEPKVDDFCLALCSTFDIQARIGTAHKLLMYVNTEMKDVESEIEKTKTKTRRSAKEPPLIDFSSYKLKEAKMLKYGIIGLVSQLLSNTEVEKLDQKQNKKLVKTYEKAMEECLVFITAVGRAMAQENNNYWQALLAGAYRILDNLQALLKHDVFVKVVSGLIVSELPMIRRKTMELLVNKLSAPKFSCSQEQVECFLDLMPQLAKAAKGTRTGEDVETANRQAALLALRALCRCFGPQNPERFQKLLPLVSKLITDETPVGVKSSTVLLLAELVTCLKAHAVSALSSFVPGVIKILQLHRKQAPGTDTLLPNTVTVIQKIVEVLPNFISPYLCDLLVDIFWLSSRYTQQEADQKMHIAHRLQLVRKHLSKDIPTRVFLPNLTKCYKELMELDQWRTIQPIMGTLSDHVSSMGPDDVANYHSSVVSLFLTALDFRVSHPDTELDVVVKTEDCVNQAVSSLVMKLSESTFRPLFYRLYDWATNSEASKDRLLTFYHLCDCLAAKMKNLFTKFAGHVLQNVASILEANNTDKTKDLYFPGDKSEEKSTELLNLTIDVLHKCFLYDNEGFVTKERFETLMSPLVCQLDNMQGGVETYRQRVSEHLVPCLVQLAVAAGDDGSWKPLNYQICLKTRHADPTVRFAALQVLESLHEKLGADYMSLLPETIQFLAELTEDENYEVEQQCHQVIKQLEKTLGEPLSKYF